MYHLIQPLEPLWNATTSALARQKTGHDKLVKSVSSCLACAGSVIYKGTDRPRAENLEIALREANHLLYALCEAFPVDFDVSKYGYTIADTMLAEYLKKQGEEGGDDENEKGKKGNSVKILPWRALIWQVHGKSGEN